MHTSIFVFIFNPNVDFLTLFLWLQNKHLQCCCCSSPILNCNFLILCSSSSSFHFPILIYSLVALDPIFNLSFFILIFLLQFLLVNRFSSGKSALLIVFLVSFFNFHCILFWLLLLFICFYYYHLSPSFLFFSNIFSFYPILSFFFLFPSVTCLNFFAINYIWILTVQISDK